MTTRNALNVTHVEGFNGHLTILLHSLRTYLLIRAVVSRGGGWGAGGLKPPPPQFLAEQLTLSQPGWTDYARHSTTSPLGFSDLATDLIANLPYPAKVCQMKKQNLSLQKTLS